MATRKKPKKLTKASVKKMMGAVKPEFRGFVASDPKDEPQAEGVNRFVEEASRFAQSAPKSPWMKLQEALDLAIEAEAELFSGPLTTADQQILAIRCRRHLRLARVELSAASEMLEWINESRASHLDRLRRQHNAAVGGTCLEPADLATSTWFHTDSIALATDKGDPK